MTAVVAGTGDDKAGGASDGDGAGVGTGGDRSIVCAIGGVDV
jgi:hypothetical protein